MRLLTGHKQWLAPLVFSPDGRYLAASAESQSPTRLLHVWDLESPADGPAWVGDPDSLVSLLAFTPDSRHLIGCTWRPVYRVELGTWEERLDAFLEKFRPVALAADGRLALARTHGHKGPAAATLRLRAARLTEHGWATAWRVERGYSPPDNGWLGYSVLLISTDGARVVRVYGRRPAAGTLAETGIQSFDAATGKALGEWVGELPAHAHMFTAGPGWRVVLLRDRAFYAVDTTDPLSKPVKRVNKSPKHFTAAAFSPDGRWLATTSNDTAVTLWDTATWQPTRTFHWEIGRLRSVAFAPDGLRCAAGSDTGQVVIWDVDG